MRLSLDRFQISERGTFGRLYIDDIFQCYTAEPPLHRFKENKPYAISEGTYNVILNYSNRFSSKIPYNQFSGVPLLENVKGFSGIRIHIGNYPLVDTEGCILVGETLDKYAIGNSTNAYKNLMKKLDTKQKITLTIKTI